MTKHPTCERFLESHLKLRDKNPFIREGFRHTYFSKSFTRGVFCIYPNLKFQNGRPVSGFKKYSTQIASKMASRDHIFESTLQRASKTFSREAIFDACRFSIHSQGDLFEKPHLRHAQNTRPMSGFCSQTLLVAARPARRKPSGAKGAVSKPCAPIAMPQACAPGVEGPSPASAPAPARAPRRAARRAP